MVLDLLAQPACCAISLSRGAKHIMPIVKEAKDASLTSDGDK
jgi:hypothetical protein